MIRIADRHIIHGFSVTLLFLSVAKIIGAAKEMMIAHNFGTGVVVDAYALGVTLAQAPITLVAMTGNMILIPFFVAQNRAGGGGAEQTGLMLAAAGLGIVLSAGVFAILRWGGGWLTPDAALAELLARQAGGFALMVPSGVIAAVLAARLIAGRRHINSLCEAIPSTVMIAGLMAGERAIAADIALAWLSCLGMLAYLGALLFFDRRNVMRTGTAAPPALPAGRDVAMILSAQVIFVASGVVLDQLAAAALPSGQNATLAYAQRLLILVTALGATAIGRTVLPVLSAARLDARGAEIALTRRWALCLFVTSTLVCAAAMIAAPSVVRILYERGAFTAADTDAVTSVLRISLLTLPLYFPSLILSQSAVVQRRFGMFLASNAAAACCKGVIVILFLDRWGLGAIVWGAFAKQAVSLAFTLPALRARKGTT